MTARKRELNKSAVQAPPTPYDLDSKPHKLICSQNPCASNLKLSPVDEYAAQRPGCRMIGRIGGSAVVDLILDYRVLYLIRHLTTL